MKELMLKLGVKHRHSTPCYPQYNGLVEKVNGMVCKIISKHVGDNRPGISTLMQHFGHTACLLGHLWGSHHFT